jgi:hypothetical protein
MSKHQLDHQLAGYHRGSEILAVEYNLDQSDFKKIKKIIAVDDNDPELISSYPLNNGQLRAISNITGMKLDNDRYEFFLEPA